MGYLFIVVGLALLVAGIIIVVKPTNSTVVVYREAEQSAPATQVIEKENENTSHQAMSIHNSTSSAETTETPVAERDEMEENKAKGDAFEKFVVKKFSPKYFTLQEWRSDKYVDGTYAVSNHYPDLEVHFELRSKGIKDVFAVECKWRRNYYQGGIEWANDYQVTNYKKYAAKLNIPVFVVIGVGGEPDQPEDLFIIPLNKLEGNTISKASLFAFKKDESHPGLFWDSEGKVLK